MDTLILTGVSMAILGVLVLGVFVVSKRLDDAIAVQKEVVELLKKGK